MKNLPIQNQMIADTYEEYAANPSQYVTIKGVPASLVVRLDTFTKSGVSGEVLVEAIRKAGPEMGPATKGWTEVLMEYGDTAYTKASEMLEKSRIHEASQEFLKASFWFFFARYPHIFSPAAAESYTRHIEAYKKSVQYSAYKAEEIPIAFNGNNIPTYLRMPNTKDVPPLVILCGGTDVWKSDVELHVQSEAFLREGIATLSIDHPGTGECPPLSPEQEEEFFLAVLRHAKKESKIDGARVAFYGLSFGGLWGAKLALLASELLATVNIGGPMYLSFEAQWVDKLPIMLKRALGIIVGVDPIKQPMLFVQALQERSMAGKLIPEGGQKVPLLCINGEQDHVVPIEEFDYLKKIGMKLDTLVFSRDRHVASGNADLRDAFTTLWIAKKLGISNN